MSALGFRTNRNECAAKNGNQTANLAQIVAGSAINS